MQIFLKEGNVFLPNTPFDIVPTTIYDHAAGNILAAGIFNAGCTIVDAGSSEAGTRCQKHSP